MMEEIKTENRNVINEPLRSSAEKEVAQLLQLKNRVRKQSSDIHCMKAEAACALLEAPEKEFSKFSFIDHLNVTFGNIGDACNGPESLISPPTIIEKKNLIKA